MSANGERQWRQKERENGPETKREYAFSRYTTEGVAVNHPANVIM